MGRFYLRLWLAWVVRVSVESVAVAGVVTLVVVLFFYVHKGLAPIDAQVQEALWQLFVFWFWIVWSVTFLLSLFRSVKYFFGRCYNGYLLRLLSCDLKESIESIGYGDLLKVWRRWFMLLIWIVSVFVLVGSAIGRFLFFKESLFAWFGLGWLYLFVMGSGFFAIVLSISLCKRIKVERC